MADDYLSHVVRVVVILDWISFENSRIVLFISLGFNNQKGLDSLLKEEFIEISAAYLKLKLDFASFSCLRHFHSFRFLYKINI